MDRFKFELAKHIPDLYRYSRTLCLREEDANRLLSDTIQIGLEKKETKPDDVPMYTWLTRTMYRQFLNDYYNYAGENGSTGKSDGSITGQFILPSTGKKHVRKDPSLSVH